MSNLLIKGGSVIDGTGRAARSLDIRVRDGLIVDVAQGLVGQGESVIDATGLTVAPGFIDSHTHYDATIYWDPLCDPMPQHGVTSVVIGNCALGLAPMRPDDRSAQVDVYSYVEDMPVDILEQAIPWRWETFAEYAAFLGKQRLGVNVAGFVGHSQLRIYVMGDAAWERAATAEEISAISGQLDQALAAGALGLSYSLFDRDRKGRPVPSILADYAEMDALFAVLGRHGAGLQFVISGDVAEKVLEELRWIGRYLARHNVTGFYNAVVQLDAEPGRLQQITDLLESLNTSGTRMLGMVSPREFELSIGFEQSICFISVPAWNELVQAPAADKRRLLADPQWRARARSDAASHASAMFPFDKPELLRIGAVGTVDAKPWLGRTLADLTLERGGDVSDVLADWLQENDLNASFIFAIANNDPAIVAKLLQHSCTFISGSDAGAHLQMFCAAGDGTLLLTRYVRERGDMTLEAAVHGLTGRQAELLGLRDRGTIAPGQAADLTIFALDELRYEPAYLVDDVPGGHERLTRPPGGYRYTILAGEVVQESGQATGQLPGGWVGRIAA